LRKIGIFLNNELMLEYPNVPESYIKSVEDCKFAIKETGHFHELKYFDGGETITTNELEKGISELADILIKKGEVMPFDKAWEKINSSFKRNTTFEQVLDYIEKNK
jgi:aromatic ring-cleaving dioxygenase